MFSAQTRHYFARSRGFGHLAAPTHQSKVGSQEYGHYFQLQLQIDDQGLVRDLAYYCPRCVPAIACGSYLHERLVGHQAGQSITVEQVITALGGLPPQRSFYAWMAVQALQTAL